MTAEPRPGPALPAALAAFWACSLPVTLQGADFRLIEANAAYAALVARTRGSLRGRDPLDFEAPEARDEHRRQRQQWAAAVRAGQPPGAQTRRLHDAQGRLRWFSTEVLNVGSAAAPQWLALWHETSAEVQARALALRAQDEMAQWFELSGSGMLVFDAAGAVVRCNAAFEALVDRVPETLAEAGAELQSLLGWQGGALLPALSPLLVPGAPALERQALVPGADGRRRRLSARLACHAGAFEVEAGAGGGRRLMAVVHDLSAEDERDLARLEMGVLMDTASVGVATYDPARGWLAPGRGAPRRPQATTTPTTNSATTPATNSAATSAANPGTP
ncbi:MAG: PAS domain-containing protein, partial [Burkholderiales bacterium]|nr:PAS domain-containing protein [Burkholderiales bacterium]